MEKCRLNIILVIGVVGWNILVNNQLFIEFVKNLKVKVIGFVLSSIQEQKEQVKELNVEFVDDLELDGFFLMEFLFYLLDDFEIDVLFMYLYGFYEGKYVQVIRKVKKCKWFYIIYIIGEEFVKYMDNKCEQELEYQLQFKLSQKVDSVIVIGFKVVDIFRFELCYCGKSNDVIELILGIMKELVGVRKLRQFGEMFRILISVIWFVKYYRVKGLDIVVKVMTFL